MGRRGSKRIARSPRTAGGFARELLRGALRELHERLPRAAHHADEDVEHVHRLRVAARRGLTVARLLGELLRPRDRRRLRRLLRDVRRATGEARDLDVLLLEHAGPYGATHGPWDRALLAGARERRVAVQVTIESLQARVASDARRAARERRMLRRVARRGREVPARPWAAARLADLFERFVDATPLELCDVGALHRYRIRAKDLRYALDGLAPLLPRRLVRDVGPTLAELQGRLGDAQDCAVLAARLREWADASCDRDGAAFLRALAARKDEALAAGLVELRAWWRPRSEARFLAAFAAGLQRAAAR